VNELFGIPLDTLLAILAVGLAVAFGLLAVLAVRIRPATVSGNQRTPLASPSSPGMSSTAPIAETT